MRYIYKYTQVDTYTHVPSAAEKHSSEAFGLSVYAK